MNPPRKSYIIQNKLSSNLPRDPELLKSASEIQQKFQLSIRVPLKKIVTNNRRLQMKFLSRLITKNYQINQNKSDFFNQSIIFYAKMINESNICANEFKKLMNWVNDRYNFKNQPQLHGLLIGNLLIIRLDNPEYKRQTSEIIEKIFTFTGRDRQFCDYSQIMYYKMLDIFDNFISSFSMAPINYMGVKYYNKIQNIFQNFDTDIKQYFQAIWKQFKLNEYEIVKLIQKLTKMKGKTQKEKSLSLFAFTFLLKFLLTQNKHKGLKISQQMTKTILSVISKLCYIVVNTDLKHFNWFFITFKFIMSNKDFFAESRLKFQLALYVLKINVTNNYTLYKDTCIQDFIKQIRESKQFQEYEMQIKQQFPHIASLTMISQGTSQLISFEPIFSQKRKTSYEYMNKFLSQTNISQISQQHKVQLNLMTHKSQILSYAETKLQKGDYLQLFVSLEQIYQIFETKMRELTGSFSDDMRHEKLKELQTWYVTSYMKILVHLVSPENNLLVEGYMTKSFIEQFYQQIVSRFVQLSMTEINFQGIYDILYQDYQIKSTFLFDFQNQKYGLKQIFDRFYLKQKLMGSFVSTYELGVLKKYFDKISNGVVSIRQVQSNQNNQQKQFIKFINQIKYRYQLVGEDLVSKLKKQQNPNHQQENQQKLASSQILQYMIQSQDQKILKKNENSKDIITDSYKKSLGQHYLQKISTKPSQNKALPIPNKVDSRYDMMFKPTQISEFQSPNPIPFYFIKSEIIRMIEYYKIHYLSSPMNSRNNYWDLFQCLVIIIDNEEILMDIYSNVLFRMLSDKKENIVFSAYENIGLVRKLHGAKYKETFKHTKFARNYITCIFERLRKIQIKSSRQKNKSSNNAYLSNPMHGRHKNSSKNKNQNLQEFSSVYVEYFEQLFNCPQKDVISYARELYSLKKFKQATFVLQIVRERLENIHKQLSDQNFCSQNLFGRNKIEKKKETNKMILDCDYSLTKCYSALVKQFRQMKNYITQKCITSKIDKKIIQKEILKKNHWRSIHRKRRQRQIKNQLNKNVKTFSQSSLITNLSDILVFRYTSQHQKIMKRKFINSSGLANNLENMIRIDQFKSTTYSKIVDYAAYKINKLVTVQDLKRFYIKIILSGSMYNWYMEKYMELQPKMQKNQESRLESQTQKINESGQYDEEYFDLKNINTVHKNIAPNYSEVLRQLYDSVHSSKQKLSIVNMMNKVQCLNNKYSLLTFKTLDQLLMENGKQYVIFDFLKQHYQGIDKYENLNILDLELLQKYHFKLGNYQNIKAITKHIQLEKHYCTFGQKSIEYLNLPQIFGYTLIAKIFDYNAKQNPKQHFNDFFSMIKEDNIVVVEGKKFKLQDLKKSPNLVVNIQKNIPKIYLKICQQLENKIRQYFYLLRVAFSKYDFSKNEGSLTIFEIMEYIFNKLFIPQIVKDKIYEDFFLYFLRFFCEKINAKFLVTRQSNNQRLIQLKQQTKKQYALMYGKNKFIEFLLKNIPYVKKHTLYMLRSLDSEANTDKNKILRKIIVEIFTKNPQQNIWTLAYLKFYEKNLPLSRYSQQELISMNVHPNDKNYRFKLPFESQINLSHNSAIKQLYRDLCSQIRQARYSQLVSVPAIFYRWLERTAIQRIDDPNKPGENYYFSVRTNIQKELQQINKKIRNLNFKIPYPFDHKLYIKKVQNIKLSVYEGKSMPCFVTFSCGLYSQIENKQTKNQSNHNYTEQSNTFSFGNRDIQKQILLKNNFTTNDHRIETNTANFYKQTGLLDPQTTYGIINLTKYILIIQKICVEHKSLKELLFNAYDINDEITYKAKCKFNEEMKLKCENIAYLYQPKWYDRSIQIRKETQKKHLFYHFYHSSISNYKHINQWWTYINNYVKTMAYWSYMCYITRLGDRHLTNIMVSTEGKFIHIDYEYNFGVGLFLGYPQWIPFRLTDLMIQSLGSFKEKGLFFAYFVHLAKIFDPESERIWKAMSHFEYSQRQFIEVTSQFKTEAVQIARTIEERCEKVMETSMDKSLLRLIYEGWQPDM